MPRGQTTTTRTEQIERELHKLLVRHPTDEQVRAAHLKIGASFEERGRRYQITEIYYEESTMRLIAIGKLAEGE